MNKFNIFALVFFIIITQKTICQQFLEEFTGNDISKWTFSGTDFVAASERLRSNNTSATAITFEIFTKLNLTNAKEWSFFTEFQFNPSSQNYTEIHLQSDSSPIAMSNGYFLRLGGTADNISFYKSLNKVSTQLILGAAGIFNQSTNTVFVTVKYLTDTWYVYYKQAAADTLKLGGKCADVTPIQGNYFGWKIVQTTSNSKKHFLDDIYIGPTRLDTTGPRMIEAITSHPDSLVVRFNEPVRNVQASQFLVNNNSIKNAIQNTENEVTLVLNSSMQNGITYKIQNAGSSDKLNNLSKVHFLNFMYLKGELPNIGDIVINEIMANPDPGLGIFPTSAEYIEIYNRSNKYIQCKGLKLGDASGAVNFPDSILYPSQYYILSKNTFSSFKQFGNWIGLESFPSFNNDEDRVNIISADNKVLHSVSYKNSWHSDAIKSNGGWSLERIDTGLWCVQENNFSSCKHSNGGTPGQANSISKKIIPAQAYIKKIRVIASNALDIYFNVLLDSATIADSIQLWIDNQFIPNHFQISQQKNSKDMVWQLQSNLFQFKVNEIHSVYCKGLSTCFGQRLPAYSGKIGLADTGIQPGEIILNEILFDPKVHNDDYVEIYNHSNRILNLFQLFLAGKDENLNYKSVTELFSSNTSFLPGEYLLITTNAKNILEQYHHTDSSAFLELNSMPTFANSEGKVALVTRQGKEIDYLDYNEKMHNQIINNTEGISLERVFPGIASSENQNWQSATESVGFGTPGLKNSVYRDALNPVQENQFIFEKSYCTPNGDGTDEQMILKYSVSQPGYFVTIYIFDEAGNKLGIVYNNYSIQKDGILWLSPAISNRILNTGNYLAKIEAWHPTGSRIYQKIVFSVL